MSHTCRDTTPYTSIVLAAAACERSKKHDGEWGSDVYAWDITRLGRQITQAVRKGLYFSKQVNKIEQK